MNMAGIVAIILFLLWLLGTSGIYGIGWAYHVLFIASMAIGFVLLVRIRKTRVEEDGKN